MAFPSHTSNDSAVRSQIHINLIRRNCANRECDPIYKPLDPHTLVPFFFSLRQAKDSYIKMPSHPTPRKKRVCKKQAFGEFVGKLKKALRKKDK